MDIPLIVLFIGILIFLGHLFDTLFNIVKIPDLIFLIIIGLIFGPVLGLVTPDLFGLVGPVFAILTLVIILFEGGLNLKIDVIAGSLKKATTLTLVNFALTMVISALFVMTIFKIPVLSAFMLGAIVGGTTAAVVIPLVRYLDLQSESIAILSLESAMSDVLCIVVFITLLEIYQFGQFDFGFAAGRLIASIVVAAVIGAIGGIGWAFIHKRIKICSDIFSTPAFVFILYGVVEWLGFSGAIAALAFGVTLGNIRYIQHLPFFSNIGEEVEITRTERLFFSETVFLFKTFFFIFIGLSIQLTQGYILVSGLIIAVFLYIIRIPIIGIFVPSSTPVWDAIVMAIMVPKGLAAAVLASIPLQEGVLEGVFIKEAAYSVILFSIILNSLLIFVMEKTSLPGVYSRMFLRMGRHFGKTASSESIG